MDSERKYVTSLFGDLRISTDTAAVETASLQVETTKDEAASDTSLSTITLSDLEKTICPVAGQPGKHIPAPTPQTSLSIKTFTATPAPIALAKSFSTFHSFPLLPAELRIQIWTLFLTSSPPSILRANYDAYTQHFRNGDTTDPFYNPHGGDYMGTWRLTAKISPLLSTCQESRCIAEENGYERVHLARDVTQRRWFNFRNGEVWFTTNAIPHTFEGDEPRVAPPLYFPFSETISDRIRVVGVCKMLWNDWPFEGEYQYSWYYESDKEDPNDEGKQPQEDFHSAIKQLRNLEKFKLMLHGPRKYFRWGEDYPWDDNDSEWEMEKGLEILNDDFYWRERKASQPLSQKFALWN